MAEKLGSKAAVKIVSVALKKSGVQTAKGPHVEIKEIFPNPSSRAIFVGHVVKSVGNLGFSFKGMKPAIHPDATIGHVVYALAGLPGKISIHDQPKKIPTITRDILSGDIPKSIAALPGNPTVHEPSNPIPTRQAVALEKGNTRKKVNPTRAL
jgi:hypothetical protein